MSEFVFTGNAGLFSNPASPTHSVSAIAQPQVAVSPAAVAAASFSDQETPVAERQIELLLWLSNLELRLPPYGDLN